jgi:hypothetical protein
MWDTFFLSFLFPMSDIFLFLYILSCVLVSIDGVDGEITVSESCVRSSI